jgi:hypothetical protein
MHQLLYLSKALHLAAWFILQFVNNSMQGKHMILKPTFHAITNTALRPSKYSCACRRGNGGRKDKRKMMILEEDICKSKNKEGSGRDVGHSTGRGKMKMGGKNNERKKLKKIRKY